MLCSLGEHIQRTSLCGLGQTAPNAALSTLSHFKDEYEAHILEKRCPAGQCLALLTFSIAEDLCNGCAQCAQVCPASAISGEVRELHRIDQDICIHCGSCLNVCPTSAVNAT